MDSSVAQTLLKLNDQFYQTFALQFSATRQRLQPGVHRLLPRLLQAERILDLGCGNGELYRTLVSQGFGGEYTGLDNSPGLLADAAGELPAGSTSEPAARSRFLQADLANPNWGAALSGQTFDLILAFAVLHHLPGYNLRQQVLTQVRQFLAPSMAVSRPVEFIHSNWQFLNSPRLRARIQPWEAAGLSENQVDQGDFLLDWRQGGAGLRYVHHYSPEELAELARLTGFQIEQSFLSDGEGGNLSLYQIWTAA